MRHLPEATIVICFQPLALSAHERTKVIRLKYTYIYVRVQGLGPPWLANLRNIARASRELN